MAAPNNTDSPAAFGGERTVFILSVSSLIAVVTAAVTIALGVARKSELAEVRAELKADNAKIWEELNEREAIAFRQRDATFLKDWAESEHRRLEHLAGER